MGNNEDFAEFPFRQIATTEGTEFRTVDFRRVIASTAPSTGGLSQLSFEAVDQGYYWEIERVILTNSSANITAARLYVGDPNMAGAFEDGTASGNASVADNNSPIRLSSNQVLSVVWSNTLAGDIGTAKIQYKLVKRV